MVIDGSRTYTTSTSPRWTTSTCSAHRTCTTTATRRIVGFEHRRRSRRQQAGHHADGYRYGRLDETKQALPQCFRLSEQESGVFEQLPARGAAVNSVPRESRANNCTPSSLSNDRI